jgi:hypothetical protein
MYPSMIGPGSLQQETDNDPILDETLLARLTISEALQPEGDDSGEVTEDVSEGVGRTCQNSEDSTSGDSNPEDSSSENSDIARSDGENTVS